MREYFPLLLYIILGVGNVVAILFASAIFGPKRNSKNKKTVYECGLTPMKDSRQRFNVNFYLTAVIFLIFDIEMVLLLPWASGYSNHATAEATSHLWNLRLGEVGLFMGLLGLGLLFVYRRKALEWD